MLAATTILELEEQIRHRYDTLSKRLQQVAVYILDRHHSAAFDTVAVIAEKVQVPPSTLIRFANAFNFSGFNEMKQLFRQNIAEETSNYTERARLFKGLDNDLSTSKEPIDILQNFARENCNAIERLATQTAAEKLNQAVDLIANAENIYLIGLRRSFSLASYLTYALRHLDRRAFLIDGLGGMFQEQLSMVGPQDLVISISFSPYAQETIALSQMVSRSGAKQVVITDGQLSPVAVFGDVCFVVQEAKVDAFRSLSASFCLVQTLAVSLAFKTKNEPELSI